MTVFKKEKIRQQEKIIMEKKRVIMEHEQEIARLKIYQLILEKLKEWICKAPQIYNNIDIETLQLVEDKINNWLKISGSDKE
jgi:transposase